MCVCMWQQDVVDLSRRSAHFPCREQSLSRRLLLHTHNLFAFSSNAGGQLCSHPYLLFSLLSYTQSERQQGEIKLYIANAWLCLDIFTLRKKLHTHWS